MSRDAEYIRCSECNRSVEIGDTTCGHCNACWYGFDRAERRRRKRTFDAEMDRRWRDNGPSILDAFRRLHPGGPR